MLKYNMPDVCGAFGLEEDAKTLRDERTLFVISKRYSPNEKLLQHVDPGIDFVVVVVRRVVVVI